jgi:5-methylcytosine-specific restriction endonuclease McrA
MVHIDHIIPLSYFNITDINDPKIKTAWALKNLRPIWAYQNLSKNNKLDNTSKIHLMDIKIEVIQQFLDNFEVNAELTRKIQERKCGKCD